MNGPAMSDAAVGAGAVAAAEAATATDAAAERTPRLWVTGARGFLGQATRQALLDAGLGPVGVAGRTPGDTLRLDLAAPGPWAWPAGTHTLVHLAGETRDAARMAAVNHLGAQRLAEAAAAAGVRHLVHISSVGVYGAPVGSGRVDERQPRTPHGPYETSKDAGERALRAVCRAHGLRCTVLQPATVIGHSAHVPGGRRSLLGLMQGIARGRYLAFGPAEAVVNYVAVQDVAAAIAAVVADGCQRDDGPAERVWIVNTPARLSELVGWIADELGVPAPRWRLPLALGRALVGAGRVAERLGRRAPLRAEQLSEMSNTTRFDGQALATALPAYRPMGLEAAVRALVRDYRAQGWL
jgi:nucleoside-diphosphate-sugar epimerase